MSNTSRRTLPVLAADCGRGFSSGLCSMTKRRDSSMESAIASNPRLSRREAYARGNTSCTGAPAPLIASPCGTNRPTRQPADETSSNDGRYSSAIQRVPLESTTRPSGSIPLGSVATGSSDAASRMGSSLPMPLGRPESGCPSWVVSGTMEVTGTINGCIVGGV